MTDTDQATITITPEALAQIHELRLEEEDADRLGLRIEVVGVRGVDYTYDLAFQLLDEVSPDDVVTRAGDLDVIIPSDDVDKLTGATIDSPSIPGQPGLVLRNPNRPDLGPQDGPLELTGEIPDQVRQLLEKRINPAIAAHGGWADLVEVQGDTVVVELGGGCQGCGMAKATVTAGIEQTIREHIPSITRVVDITDHQAGENPYFDPV